MEVIVLYYCCITKAPRRGKGDRSMEMYCIQSCYLSDLGNGQIGNLTYGVETVWFDCWAMAADFANRLLREHDHPLFRVSASCEAVTEEEAENLYFSLY